MVVPAKLGMGSPRVGGHEGTGSRASGALERQRGRRQATTGPRARRWRGDATAREARAWAAHGHRGGVEPSREA